MAEKYYLYSSTQTITTKSGIPTISLTHTNIYAETIHVSSNVSDTGGTPITERGICWSTSSSPTIANTKTTQGTDSGVLASIANELTPNTTYYIRAYVINAYSEPAYYSNEITVPTHDGKITLETVTPNNVGVETAESGGFNISNPGDAEIIARGICWGESINPEKGIGNFTEEVTGTDPFTGQITELTAGTLYHVRAYVTTAYGALLS